MTTTTTFVGEEDLDDEPTTPEPDVEQPSSALVHTQQHESAIERAAEAAVMMPGVPGRDEFMSLAMQARILSLSGAAPQAVRDNPHLAFHIAMVGRDLGISPSASLELIDVIRGKWDSTAKQYEYRLSLSPQLLNGQIRRLGLGSIRPVERTNERALAVALDPHGEPLGPPSEFTWEDARMASLVGPECKPGDHKTVTKQRSGGGSYTTCGCNQGYITYPKRMLWWRAAGFAADDYFPEAGLGLYSPEALGAVVDEEGRPIDPASVELPEGYGGEIESSTSDDAATSTTPDEPPPGDPERAWELQRKIHALPDEQRAQMAERWKEQGALTHEVDGQRRPIRAHQLPLASMARAHSMADGFLSNAERAVEGYTRDEALKAVDVRVANRLVPTLMLWLYPLTYDETAPVSPSASPSPDAPSDAREPVSDAQGVSEAPLPPDERGVYLDHVRACLLSLLDDETDPDDMSDDDVTAAWERALAAVDLDAVPIEVTDQIIEQVKGMPSTDVRSWLAARAMTVPRGTNDARQALATRLVQEHAVENAGG
jgi:hypothetical protein